MRLGTGHQWPMGRLRELLLTGLVLVATSAGVSAAAVPADRLGRSGAIAAQVPAADTPSPTLGSTPQPGVNPPGVNDGDARDFDRTPLAVISFLFLGALVGGSLLFYLWLRNRRPREPVHQHPDSGSPQGQ
jgi:hypothetical protein